jgi:ribosomal protein S3AE
MAERKKFIDIETPFLGESLEALGTAKELENKTIHLDMSRKMRGKGLILTLQILKNKEDKLYSVPKKFLLTGSYIRRVMRKRTDYAEDSFKAVSRDGAEVTVKPLMITRKKVSRAVRKNLRNTARENLINYIKERDYIEICDELISGTLQKELLPKLKKVYPLGFFDLRVFETKDIQKLGFDKLVREEEKTDTLEETSVGEVDYDSEDTQEEEEPKEKTEEKEEVVEEESKEKTKEKEEIVDKGKVIEKKAEKKNKIKDSKEKSDTLKGTSTLRGIKETKDANKE